MNSALAAEAAFVSNRHFFRSLLWQDLTVVRKSTGARPGLTRNPGGGTFRCAETALGDSVQIAGEEGRRILLNERREPEQHRAVGCGRAMRIHGCSC